MTSWHVIIFGTLHQAGAMGVFINDVTLFWTPKTILWSQNWLLPHCHFYQFFSADTKLKGTLNFELEFVLGVHENIEKKNQKWFLARQAEAMGEFMNDVITYI